jgi:predicted ArsR family transcriptional regulator
VRGGRVGPERSLTLAESALRARGFEPVRAAPTCLTLRNCPYQPLAGKATELVCGVNHQFIAGLVRGLGSSAVQAVLEPSSTRCCVVVRA